MSTDTGRTAASALPSLPLGDRRVEAHPRIPASRRPAILTRSASFEVARIGFRPERGSHSPAQGTALGTGGPKDPCPEGAPHGVRSPACVAGPMIAVGSLSFVAP